MAKAECPRCGEISLRFAVHIREPDVSDPEEVYTVGEEWECDQCHHIECYYDHEKETKSGLHARFKV